MKGHSGHPKYQPEGAADLVNEPRHPAAGNGSAEGGGHFICQVVDTELEEGRHAHAQHRKHAEHPHRVFQYSGPGQYGFRRVGRRIPPTTGTRLDMVNLAALTVTASVEPAITPLTVR